MVRAVLQNDIVTLTMFENGLHFWHQVRISRMKLPMLDRMLQVGRVNVEELGEVVASGWGTPPKTTNENA